MSSQTHMNTAPPTVYKNRLSYRNRAGRLLWGVVWVALFRTSPTPFFWWRRFLLRCFGASIGTGANVYPRCRVWAPPNLTMLDHSCLANDVDCYCVDAVVLGEFATVSQQAMLCTATHDYSDPDFRLVTRPIFVGPRAWVGARALIGPGVEIGEGAVVGAGSVVFRSVRPWRVVGGNPARELKTRIIAKPVEMDWETTSA